MTVLANLAIIFGPSLLSSGSVFYNFAIQINHQSAMILRAFGNQNSMLKADHRTYSLAPVNASLKNLLKY